MTTWVEGLRRLPGLQASARLPYFFGFALTCIGLSAATTYAGYFLVGALPLPLAAGLLFLTPVFFIVSLAAGARGVGDWVAIVLGFALAPDVQCRSSARISTSWPPGSSEARSPMLAGRLSRRRS